MCWFRFAKGGCAFWGIEKLRLLTIRCQKNAAWERKKGYLTRWEKTKSTNTEKRKERLAKSWEKKKNIQ